MYFELGDIITKSVTKFGVSTVPGVSLLPAVSYGLHIIKIYKNEIQAYLYLYPDYERNLNAYLSRQYIVATGILHLNQKYDNYKVKK